MCLDVYLSLSLLHFHFKTKMSNDRSTIFQWQNLKSCMATWSEEKKTERERERETREREREKERERDQGKTIMGEKE